MALDRYQPVDRLTKLVVCYVLLALAPFVAAGAWFALVVWDGSILLSFAFDLTDALGFAAVLSSFGLLVSPPMRRYADVSAPG